MTVARDPRRHIEHSVIQVVNLHGDEVRNRAERREKDQRIGTDRIRGLRAPRGEIKIAIATERLMSDQCA